MPKKIAIIVMHLLNESTEKPNKEIEKEILKELGDLRVPWMKSVEKVTVLESNEN